MATRLQRRVLEDSWGLLGMFKGYWRGSTESPATPAVCSAQKMMLNMVPSSDSGTSSSNYPAPLALLLLLPVA
jgi:hypothetical protein